MTKLEEKLKGIERKYKLDKNDDPYPSKIIYIDKEKKYEEQVKQIKDQIRKHNPDFFDIYKITVAKRGPYKPTLLIRFKDIEKIRNTVKGKYDYSLYRAVTEYNLNEYLKLKK